MTRAAKQFLIYAAIVLLVIIVVSVAISKAVLGGASVGESRIYEADGEVKSLEVDIGAADFRIEKGDRFYVESNLKRLTFRQSGSRLILREKSLGNKNYNDAFLTIYIPEGTVFSKIDISTGAGRFTADVLSAEKIDFEFGAGEVNIGQLNATREADIEGGAGQITIGGGRLCDLQLDMGVGALYLTSEIVGEGELNLGVGEVIINLLGGREGYAVEMNKGIGDLRFDGESLPEGRTVGSGPNDIEINGGIGSVLVCFK